MGAIHPKLFFTILLQTGMPMKATKFTNALISRIKSIVDGGSRDEYKAIANEFGIPAEYQNDMGRLVLRAEIEENSIPLEDLFLNEIKKYCRREKDLRCQVRGVLDHLAKNNLSSKTKFNNNADATVLILDKRHLGLPEGSHLSANAVIELSAIECLDFVDLSRFAEVEKKKLCDAFFYANELIPHTNIFGSGYFFEHNKILTAAHVLDAAFYSGISAENKNLDSLIFIRGHWDFGANGKINVSADQMYVFDEQTVFPEGQVFNGAEHGDIAWVKVRKMYSDGNDSLVYKGSMNGIATEASLAPGMPLYALGHGLGVPMKLSFKGISEGMSAIAPPYFNCDLNILPGASGSPVFDSNSHQLVGIISGLHVLHANYIPQKDCLMPEIDMGGIKSGVATPVFPLLETIKNI